MYLRITSKISIPPWLWQKGFDTTFQVYAMENYEDSCHSCSSASVTTLALLTGTSYWQFIFTRLSPAGLFVPLLQWSSQVSWNLPLCNYFSLYVKSYTISVNLMLLISISFFLVKFFLKLLILSNTLAMNHLRIW